MKISADCRILFLIGLVVFSIAFGFHRESVSMGFMFFGIGVMGIGIIPEDYS